MILNIVYNTRMATLGLPVSITLLSVFTIILPPVFICFSVFVPGGASITVSVNSVPPSISRSSYVTVQGGASKFVNFHLNVNF